MDFACQSGTWLTEMRPCRVEIDWSRRRKAAPIIQAAARCAIASRLFAKWREVSLSGVCARMPMPVQRFALISLIPPKDSLQGNAFMKRECSAPRYNENLYDR